MDPVRDDRRPFAIATTARFHAKVFCALAVLVAAVFWYGCGRSLQYDVYGGEIYWYSEDFSQPFRVGLTVVVSLVAASPVWLLYALRRRKLPA